MEKQLGKNYNDEKEKKKCRGITEIKLQEWWNFKGVSRKGKERKLNKKWKGKSWVCNLMIKFKTTHLKKCLCQPSSVSHSPLNLPPPHQTTPSLIIPGRLLSFNPPSVTTDQPVILHYFFYPLQAVAPKQIAIWTSSSSLGSLPLTSLFATWNPRYDPLSLLSTLKYNSGLGFWVLRIILEFHFFLSAFSLQWRMHIWTRRYEHLTLISPVGYLIPEVGYEYLHAS